MELHALERPQAQISQLLYNTNISKKNKALALDKFYMYQPAEDKNVAASKFANAAQALIRAGKFPSWALFCYKELVAQANDLTPPNVLCYQSESAIILAPEIDKGHVTGLLIVLEEADESIQTMRSDTGHTITVKMPHVHTKVVAQDDVRLELVSG